MVAARRAHVHLVASEAHLVHKCVGNLCLGRFTGSVEFLAVHPHPTLMVKKRPPVVRKMRNFGLFFVYCRLFMRGYCPNAKLDSETVNDDCVVECADDYSSFPHL